MFLQLSPQNRQLHPEPNGSVPAVGNGTWGWFQARLTGLVSDSACGSELSPAGDVWASKEFTLAVALAPTPSLPPSKPAYDNRTGASRWTQPPDGSLSAHTCRGLANGKLSS